jgi:hypothetical protein
MNRPHVAFETDRFRNDQPDDEIGQWFLGEDLAEWLHERLVGQERVTSTCEPVEEDWGWIFGVRVEGTRFWVAIWNAHTWIVGLIARPGLLRAFRREQTATATATLKKVNAMLATPEFRNVAWYDHWPDERCR